MDSMRPDRSSLEKSIQELSNRLDLLIAEMAKTRDYWASELRETRQAYAQIAKAVKGLRAATPSPSPGRGAAGGPLSAETLEELASALKTEPSQDLIQRLDLYTVDQLKELAAHVGAARPRSSLRKGELIRWLISEAKFAEEHRKLRGY